MKDRRAAFFLIFAFVSLLLTYLTVSGPHISPLYLPIAMFVSMLIILAMGRKSPPPTSETLAIHRRKAWWLLPSALLGLIISHVVAKKNPDAWVWGYCLLTILGVGYYVSWQRAQK